MNILQTTIDTGAKAFNLTIDDKAKEKFSLLNDLLVAGNEKMNLTNITEPTGVAILHFIDSLTPMTITSFAGKKVIDVGTGAGFPGIPLAIMNPSMTLVLLDAQQKKVTFLEEVIRELELDNVSTLHMRSEMAGKDIVYRETFDVAISRAMAPMGLLLEYMAPLIAVNGEFIAMKGRSITEEMEQVPTGFQKMGLEDPEIHFLDIPTTNRVHTLVYAKKIRQISGVYPRNHGQMIKNPIS